MSSFVLGRYADLALCKLLGHLVRTRVELALDRATGAEYVRQYAECARCEKRL